MDEDQEHGATPGADDDGADDAAPKRQYLTNERLALFDKLADNAADALDTVLKEAGEEGVVRPEPQPAPTPEPRAAQDFTDGVQADLGIRSPAAPAPAPTGLDMNARVKVKIDGVEEERTVEQLIRDAQKAGAADRRLAEATHLLRQVQAAQTAPPAQTAETPVNVQPSAVQRPPTPAARDRVKAALASLMEGDEDAAADKLTELLAAREAPSAPVQMPDTDQLAQAVTRKLEEGSALQAFFGEYQRIAGSPWAQQAADATMAQVRTQYPDLPFAQQLAMVGDAVYHHFGWQKETQAPPQNAPATTPRSTQIASRKARLDIPTGRTGSAATSQQSAPVSSEEARAQIVAEMQRMRTARRPEPPL